MKEEKQTLMELFAGVVVCVLILMLGNLITEKHLAYTLGLLLGGAIAIVMSGHMYTSLGEAVLYDQKTAEKKVKFGSLLRMVMMIAALTLAALLPNIFSFVAVVLGISALKFAAYLQPLTHRVFNKFIHKGR